MDTERFGDGDVLQDAEKGDDGQGRAKLRDHAAEIDHVTRLGVVQAEGRKLERRKSGFDVSGQDERRVPVFLVPVRFRQHRIEGARDGGADDDDDRVASRRQEPDGLPDDFSAGRRQKPAPKVLAARGWTAFVDRMKPGDIVQHLLRE